MQDFQTRVLPLIFIVCAPIFSCAEHEENDQSARPQRANLDGSNVEVLITTELGDIDDMNLDVENGKIYWRVRIE